MSFKITIFLSYRLVYNIRDLSTDPSNERDAHNKSIIRENQIQVNNPYAQDILGNTEIELELHQVQADRAAQFAQNLNQNREGLLEESVNSPRLVHHDTEVPQNLVTSVANHELRSHRLQLNTENQEDLEGLNGQDNANINNYFENLSTERGNDLMNNVSFANNNGFMNNSNSYLLNNSLDQKLPQQRQESNRSPKKVLSDKSSSVKSLSCV